MDHSREIALGRLRIEPQAAIAAGVTLLFVGLSTWWLLYDLRPPGGGDAARHLAITVGYGELLGDADFGSIFESSASWGPDFFYPPLVHLVGSVPAALGLAVEDWGTIALNLVFVPLLAAGCYLVGRLVYGATAGLLAVVFALGTPMVLSLFHVYMLDAPLAAMVAISLWALLASDRFSRRRESALAGLLIGLALMVKPTAPLFLAGPVLVMLIGGGWRQWRNLAIAAALALAVSAPYYLQHLGTLIDTTEGATVTFDPPGNAGEGGGFNADYRFSLDNLTWYFWNAVNVQYFVPLLALFATGLVSALAELRRRRHLPELLAGLVFGYAALTLLSIRDPRYTLPLVVYVAVIATGWIVVSRRTVLAVAGAALLAGAVALNVTAQTAGGIPSARISAPGDQANPGDPLAPGTFTLIDDRGYTVGPPRHNPLWERILEAARGEGLRSARIDVREAPLWGTDLLGFKVMAHDYGINVPVTARRAHHPDLVVNTWYTSDEFWTGEGGLPAPCGRVEEGTEAPPGTDPVEVSVSVARHLGDGRYERWCEF